MARKRVVAYVRVSSSSKAQIHSYEFQEQYWRGKFDGDPNACVYVTVTALDGSYATTRAYFLNELI